MCVDTDVTCFGSETWQHLDSTFKYLDFQMKIKMKLKAESYKPKTPNENKHEK